MTKRCEQLLSLFWNPIVIKSLDAALAMILLKASEVTRTHSIVCRDNCCWQNANLAFNHAANWSWHSVKTATKIKSKGEKEKMSGWDVIKKQEESLFTFSLLPLPQNKWQTNWQICWVFRNLYYYSFKQTSALSNVNCFISCCFWSKLKKESKSKMLLI